MKYYEERVVEEQKVLSEKYFRLQIFLDSESCKKVPLMEKERLHLQAYLMSKYIEVLDDRIAYFKEIE